MMKRIHELYKKYKQIILYVFFGICTTIINTVVYDILYNYANISNIASTVIAWLVAVLFAFFTNKDFVFASKTNGFKDKFNQFISFFICRILTGVLDVIIMFIAIDCLKQQGALWKLISNVIVTVINYVASKKLIFRNR